VTVTKALDEDGDVRMHHHASDGLSTWEAIGLLTVTLDTLRKAMTDDG
jgi:hypothetical protein